MTAHAGSGWVSVTLGRLVPLVLGALFAAQTALAQVAITTVDAVGSIGPSTSIAIGADGLPVIAYRDGATGELKVAKCINAACSGVSTITPVDQVGIVGGYSSIAIGADGLPVISYRDEINAVLRVAKCGDAACSAGNTLTTVDDTGNVGEFNRVRIGADGLPVIAYYDATNRDLKVAKCANAACTGESTITAVDSAGNAGGYTSIAIGADGLPVIAYSYLDGAEGDLRVAKCVNAACTGTSTITTVDAVEDVGRYTAIAIGADGRPVIAYSYASAANLKVAKCANAACTGTSTVTTVDADGIVGSHISIAIGADALPVISYSGSDSVAVWLKVAKCGDAACSAGNLPRIVDAVANAGYSTSIAIGADGLPVVSYFRGASAQLVVAKCANPSCAPGPAARADFDGDGKSDIPWRNSSTGENYLYPMDGLAILGSEGYLRTVADQSWQVAGTGDFDGDGKADILWRNSSTGENYIYLMSATAIAGEGYIRTVAEQSWQVAGIGDFDGDGKSDILWRNSSTGENYLYPMNGLAILGGEGYLRTVADLNWGIAGVGDFDGEGRSDILWRNTTTGENYLYPMNGTAILGTEGYLRTVVDLNWKVAGTGDFDGDGNADILWRNSATGENYAYLMDGTTIAAEGYLRTVADQNWQVTATGDYDGDGKADVLWRHAASGENYLYFMDGTAIKPTEGFIRTVADQNWAVAARAYSAASNCAELGSPELLVNGNFDAGPTSEWIQSSSFPLIVNTELPISVHSSAYLAWLGGVFSATDSLYQEIAVPSQPGQMTVSGYSWIATEETAGVFDTFSLSIRSTSDVVLETLLLRTNLDSSGSWVPFQISASGNYAGTTVRLYLTSSNDVSLATSFFFDTLSVKCN